MRPILPLRVHRSIRWFYSIAVCLVCPVALANVLAIKAGAVVDPSSATISTNQTILVEGGKITAIGNNVPVPSGANVIDLSSQTVLPGLIDAHTHLFANMDPKWDLSDTWIMTLQRRPGYRAILGAQYAKEFLEAGFTAVRDVGNSGEYLAMDLEKDISFERVMGPQRVRAGRLQL